jgi:hypothetical protein
MPSHYVFRAIGLPMDATVSDIEGLQRFLVDGEKLNLVDGSSSIVPSCYPDDSMSALFGVRLPLPKFLDRARFTFSLRGKDIRIDRDFFGFTQLYPTEQDKPILAE